MKIEKLVYQGYGLGRDNGKIVFVPYTAPGDEIEYSQTKIKRRLIFGEIKKIVSPSKNRIEPVCPLFGKCGGCDYQHIPYTIQLKEKKAQTLEHLMQIGNLSCFDDLKIHPSKSIFNYRNSALFHISESGLMGFYLNNSTQVTETDYCYITDEKINKIFFEIRSLFKRSQRKKLFNHISIRNSDCCSQTIFIGSKKQFKTMNKLEIDFPEIFGSVIYNIEGKKSRLGLQNILLRGDYHFKSNVLGKEFNAAPDAFFQINIPQTENIIKFIRGFLQDKKIKKLTDLYAGTGLLGISVSDLAEEIEIVEINSNALRSSKENAEKNGVKNISFVLQNSSSYILPETDCLILDPPRRGISKNILTQLKEKRVKYIVYVSCNPSTFARDVHYLTERAGYKALKVSAFDMFPQTYHIETAGIFMYEPSGM